MAGLGIGLGAFMQGFTSGASAAQSIKRGQQQEKLTNMQIKDLEDERANRQEVRDISSAGVQEANQNTDGAMDNVMNYYMKNTVPKIQQSYLKNGDVKTADTFGKWVQDANVQQGMRYGAGMIRAAQQNDPQGVMDNMVKLYNQPGYFEDGKSAVDAKIVNGEDGKPSGMSITLRDNATGKDETHTFNSMKDVYDLAMQFGQPDQVFKYGMDQLAAGQKVQAEIAKEDRDWNRDNQKAARDQGYALEKDNNASQLRQAEETAKLRNPGSNKKVADATATIAFLKQNGASDEYIRTNMAGILGIENRSRPASSRIDDYIKMRMDSDRKFRDMPLDKQIAEAQSYIAAVDKQAGEGQGIGLPDATTPAQQPEQGNGVLFLDTKTGKIISR